MEKIISKNARTLIFASIVGFVGINLWQIIAHVISIMVYVNITGNKELAKKAVENNEWLTNLFNVVMELVLGWIVYHFVKREGNKQSFFHSIDMDRSNLRVKPFLLGMAIAATINIPFWITADLARWISFKSSGFSEFSPFAVIGYLMIMGVVTLFPGVCEEIFFRGYLQKRLFGMKGKWFSLIIPSLLFIVFHIGRYHDITTAIYLFVISMVIGYLYYMTGSLYISIGFHYIWDFIASMFDDRPSPSLFKIKVINESGLSILYTVLLLFVFLIVLLKTRKPSVKSTQNNGY